MRKGKEILPITFEKGIDQDTPIRELPRGYYINAVNMEPLPGSSGGAKRVAYGHEEIEYDFGLGFIFNLDAKGAVENKEGDFGVVFVAGDTDYIYWTNGKEARLLLSGNSIEFDETDATERVHSAVIVEGRYLYWVFSAYWNSENAGQFKLAGTRPKKLDIQRHMPKDSIEYELVLNGQGYSSGSEYSYEITDRFGNVISGPTVFYTVGAPGTRADIMLALFNSVSAIPGVTMVPFSLNTPSDPAPRLRFLYQGASQGERIRIFASGGGGEDIVQSELNFYPVDITGEHLALIKPCPLYEPSVSYVEDASSDSNINPGQSYQFRYRYLFDDGEKSAWGPASIIPTNYRIGETGEAYYENDPALNKIQIDLNGDDKLNNAAWRVYIRKIEVAYKTDRTSIWKTVDVYDIYKFDYENITIDFYGIASNLAVPSDEDASEGAQALKNFDNVPVIASAMEFVYDETGNGVLLLGGGIYDYDIIPLRSEISVVERSLDTTISGTSQVSKAKSLKRGGKYKIGVALKDWAGRQTTAFFLKEITIPWALGEDSQYTEDVAFDISATMVGAIPQDMAAYQFVVTENLNQAVWWRSPRTTLNPRYSRLDLETNDLIDTASNRTDADFVGFLVYYDGDAGNSVIFSGFGNDEGFIVPESGDRMQIMSWEDSGNNPGGTPSPAHADRDQYNYKIAGYQFGTNAVGPYMYVLIDLYDDVPDWYWTNRVSLEVYRPKTVANDQVYYEFGPVGEINFAYFPVDLSGYGDVYLSKKESKDYSLNNDPPPPVLREYTDTQLLNSRQDPDLGRAVPVNANYKRKFDTSIIRASDIFVPNSEVNGLSSFRSTSFIYVNAALGPITKLVLNQDVLLAITASKTQPIYVAKDRLMSLSGAQVGRTSRLLNLASELRYDYGTIHPDSVVYEQGRTYGFDRRKGIVWRYSSGNGQQPIVTGLFNYFRSIAEWDSTLARRVFEAGFDRETELYYLNMADRAVMFSERSGWVGFSSDAPQAFLPLNIRLLSITRDKLFIRSKDAPRANYFGFQFSAFIRIAGNTRPAIALFDSVEINATGKWYANLAETPASPSYPNGQESTIPASYFSYYEGRAKAPFLRDGNDPDPRLPNQTQRLLTGRPLRNDAITLQLFPVNSELDNVITIAYIYWQLSRQTTTQ